jgi:4-amino-4-deoxy-L-arabinose transferase-like glycosyltransferase
VPDLLAVTTITVARTELLQFIRRSMKGAFALVKGSEVPNVNLSLLLFPLAFSLVIRLPFLIWPDAIYRDSTVYITAARGILEGRWAETIVPPLYPALIAAISLLQNDFETAGIIVSFVFSSLLVIPIFYLGRELYNARVGMVAALLAAVQPCLFKYSGAVLTESIYYFIVALMGVLALKAHASGKSLWTASLGFTIALAYLTRPEAVGFLIVFMGWVLLVSPRTGKRPVVRRISIALVGFLCFAALSSPYLLLLKKELGHWTLSKKVNISVGSEDVADTVSMEDGLRSGRVSISSWARHPISLAKAVVFGGVVSLYKFQVSFTPILLLLAVWGLIVGGKSDYPWNQSGLLLAFILFFFCLVFPFFKMSARYSSQMIPLALPWAAHGCIDVVERLAHFRRWRPVQGRVVGTALSLLMAILLLQGVIESDRGQRRLQREVGFWLRENAVPGQKVMSNRIHEAFYARMELVPYQDGDLENLIRMAHSMSIRYVVIDDGMEKGRPDFLETMKGSGFVLLRHWIGGEDRIWLFENPGPTGVAIQPSGSEDKLGAEGK